MTALARFGHHSDPEIDFRTEVDELEAMAFDRRVGANAAEGLEERIRAAKQYDISPDWESVLAREALRELELEFLKRDIWARRRAEARLQRMEREFGEASWLA